MIFDGPDHFPGSCCEYAEFERFELRELFAALRQREQILQQDTARPGISDRDRLVGTTQLQEVQRWIIWMAHNIATDATDLDAELDEAELEDQLENLHREMVGPGSANHVRELGKRAEHIRRLLRKIRREKKREGESRTLALLGAV